MFSRELLRTIHKNKDWIVDEVSDSLCPETISYRSLHVLVEIYNQTMRSIFFVFLLTCETAEIISAVTFVLHKYRSQIPLSLSMFFILAMFEAVFIILVVYGLAGDFYQQSTSSLCQLTRLACNIHDARVTKMELKYREKFLRSCQKQKIKFGLSNFIEKTKPPVFQLFCLNRMIDLMLIH